MGAGEFLTEFIIIFILMTRGAFAEDWAAGGR